jgi:hypothetical protein
MIAALKTPETWIEILILAIAFHFILNAVRGTRAPAS